MRAQLVIVCERAARPRGAVRAWLGAIAQRSRSDRSYPLVHTFSESGSYCLYTFRQALPPSAGDPPKFVLAQADANASGSEADRSHRLKLVMGPCARSSCP